MNNRMNCSIFWIFALFNVAVSIDLLRLEVHKQLNNLKKQLFDTESKVEELRAAEEKLNMIRNDMNFLTTALKGNGVEMEKFPEIKNDMNIMQNSLRGSSDTTNNELVETEKYPEIENDMHNIQNSLRVSSDTNNNNLIETEKLPDIANDMNNVQNFPIVSSDATNGDLDRLCVHNPFANSLHSSMKEIAEKANSWLLHKEETLSNVKVRSNNDHNHVRFEAFEEMSSCDKSCIGGSCDTDNKNIADRSKAICGLSRLSDQSHEKKCIVYSIGSNNFWEFELEILKETPCEVHSFDCTGPRERFKVPANERLYFHHVCLGSEYVTAPLGPIPDSKKDHRVQGPIMTLHQIQKMLNHEQIDLLKMDIEGYEWSVFESWPELSNPISHNFQLPMQINVEIHYSHMEQNNYAVEYDKREKEMFDLQTHLLKAGFATIIRDDNEACMHCSELTLVRFKC